MGSPPAMQRPSTMLCRRPYSSTDAGRARLTRSAIASDFQYEHGRGAAREDEREEHEVRAARRRARLSANADRQHEADEGEDQE